MSPSPEEWINDQWIEFDLANTTFALDGTAKIGIAAGTLNGAASEVDFIQRLLDDGATATQIYEFAPCWTPRKTPGLR